MGQLRVSKTYLMNMAVQRSGWLAVLVSICIGPMALAAEREVRGTGSDRANAPVTLGLMADAGVPDGANLALALRATPWLRVHAGGGHNTVSSGLRGGLTVLPWGAGPSASVEVGHYRDGNANGLVRGFVGANGTLAPIFERLGYTYVNTQLGLELGRGNFQFFIHGGLSFLRARLHNAQTALDARNARSPSSSTSVRINQDPIVRAWIPSLKLGMVVYFGGGA